MRSKDKIYSFLLFLYCLSLSFEEAIAIPFLGSINRIVGIVIIVYVILFYNYALKIPHIILPFLIWVLYSLVSVIWVSSYDWWWYFFEKYLFQVILMALVLAVPIKRIDMNLVERGIILSGLIASIIIIFFPLASGLTEEGRRTLILFGKPFDPNIIASIFLLGLFILLGKLIKKFTILHLICISTLVVGILFTGSRGALISLIVGVSILFILEFRKRGNIKKVILFSVFGVLLVFFVIRFLPENLLETRFSKDVILGQNELNEHGRYKIWHYSLLIFVKNPIIGYGCGNFFSAIATVYKQCASHNLFILLLVETGLIGFFIFCFGLFKIAKKIFSLNDSSSVSLFSCFMVMSLTLDAITYKYFWVMLIYVIWQIYLKQDLELNSK